MNLDMPYKKTKIKKALLISYSIGIGSLAAISLNNGLYSLVFVSFFIFMIIDRFLYSFLFDTENFLNKIYLYRYLKKNKLPKPIISFFMDATFQIGDYIIYTDIGNNMFFLIYDNNVIIHSGCPTIIDRKLNNKIMNIIKHQINKSREVSNE